MKFNNYRVVFGGEDIDYKSNFKDCVKYIGVIRKIFIVLDLCDVKHKWYFFEPYVEITWIDDNDKFALIKKNILELLERENISDAKFSTPDNGAICDWYCDSDLEREFGYQTYSESSKLALLFFRYAEVIKRGKGLENQYVRRCHVLACQLAINYKQEGIYLIKRGILCLLFWFLGHHKAVWIYRNILRCKY